MQPTWLAPDCTGTPTMEQFSIVKKTSSIVWPSIFNENTNLATCKIDQKDRNSEQIDGGVNNLTRGGLD